MATRVSSGRLAVVSVLAFGALALQLAAIARTSALMVCVIGTLTTTVALHVVERRMLQGHIERADATNVGSQERRASHA